MSFRTTWIYYLKNNQVKDEFKAKGLDGVRQRLNFDALSEQTAYLRTLENKSIERSVMDTAREEGREAKAVEVARQMKTDGMQPS